MGKWCNAKPELKLFKAYCCLLFVRFHALQLILESQFVVSRLLPSRCWKVITGSGMSLKLSSKTADLALLHSVELMGAQIALSCFIVVFDIIC